MSSNPAQKKKKNLYQKEDFSDEEIRDEIKQDLRKIRERDIPETQKEQEIFNLYDSHKQQKNKRRILFDKDPKYSKSHAVHQNLGEEQEEGEVHEAQAANASNTNPQHEEQKIVTIGDLGDPIRRITLTRNKIQDLLNSPRFQQLVKGCWVRYLSDKTSNTSNTYMIAQVVGITEGPKQYPLTNMKTKVLLRLQETSEVLITLSIQLISNKHPPGSLEIEKWLRANRSKIPKEADLKLKLEQHSKLLIEQLSSKEIDNNILKKVRKVANCEEEPKEDLGSLIEFMSTKIHDLEMQKDDLMDQKGKEDGKAELEQILKEEEEYKVLARKLRDILVERKKKKENQPKNQDRRKKLGFSAEESNDIWGFRKPKEDTINEKAKAKITLLSTDEGYQNIKSNIVSMHSNFDFPL